MKHPQITQIRRILDYLRKLNNSQQIKKGLLAKGFSGSFGSHEKTHYNTIVNDLAILCGEFETEGITLEEANDRWQLWRAELLKVFAPQYLPKTLKTKVKQKQSKLTEEQAA